MIRAEAPYPVPVVSELKRLIVVLMLFMLLMLFKLAFPPSERSRSEAADFMGMEREKIQVIGKRVTDAVDALWKESAAP